MEKKMFRLLFVEDDEKLRSLFSEELSALGVEVFQAEGALEALSILKSEKIDGVLTDMKMPDIDGVGLKKMAESQMEVIPKIWVVFTAYSDRPLKELQDKGFDEVFFKPFNPKMITHFFTTKLGL